MRHAINILKFLRDVKEADQKTIAENLDVHPTILGRIVATLEDSGYVKRIRGKRKTWKVIIQ
jgi:DNA-binding MarR family transcriptional regulator